MTKVESSVNAVKLSTGEEFIGAVTDIGGGRIEVKDPVTIMQNPQTGQASFSPWFAFSEARTFSFDPDQVMFNNKAGKEVVDGYSRAFSLIETPKEKKIII